MEVNRIQNYYNELINENKKRIKRKGLSDERKNDIAEKNKALIIEMNKQIAEIKDKFTTKINVSLENATQYHVPVLKFLCIIKLNREIQQKEFYYDHVFKKIVEM